MMTRMERRRPGLWPCRAARTRRSRSTIDSHLGAEQCGDKDNHGHAGALAPVGCLSRKINNWQEGTPVTLVIPAMTCKEVHGAGEENRTRTISLGIRLIRPARAADQPGRATGGVRD
jgi:hypothetical protein